MRQLQKVRKLVKNPLSLKNFRLNLICPVERKTSGSNLRKLLTNLSLLYSKLRQVTHCSKISCLNQISIARRERAMTCKMMKIRRKIYSSNFTFMSQDLKRTLIISVSHLSQRSKRTKQASLVSISSQPPLSQPIRLLVQGSSHSRIQLLKIERGTLSVRISLLIPCPQSTIIRHFKDLHLTESK